MSELDQRVQNLENEFHKLFGGQYEPSKLRRQRAEADAQRKAEEDYRKSPAAQDIQQVSNRVKLLEDFIRQLRGEEGITNEGPIFRLERKPANDDPLGGFQEVSLLFCDQDDVQHTGTFLVKDIVPPL